LFGGASTKPPRLLMFRLSVFDSSLRGFREGLDKFRDAWVIEQVRSRRGRREFYQPLFGGFQPGDGLDPGCFFVRSFSEDVVCGLGFHGALSVTVV